MKILNKYEDIPIKIRKEIDDALAEDILLRYNSSEYHDPEIINNILQEHGYQLI